MIRCRPGLLADALRESTLPAASLVFVADCTSDEWNDVASEMAAAFDLSQAAARSGGAVIYILGGDDLLGRRGPGAAMVACGLLSAARTLALETAKSGVPVNAIALGPDTSPQVTAFWAEALCRPGGPTGGLVQLGRDHLGKALS